MQLDIIRAIQRFSNPVLDIIMECLTAFGEQIILTGVFCAVYWCYDKRLGRFIGFTLGLSLCFNGVIKDFFKVERIFGEPGIISHRVETATGYSFPSGHTQTATAMWGSLFTWTKRPLLRIILALLIVTIGFSRLYLGVHYPLDVCGGILFGAACVAISYYIVIVKDNRILILAFCLLAGALAIFTGESPDTFKAAGMLLGIYGGFYFEEKYVGFEMKVGPIPKLLRYVSGIAFVGAVYVTLKLIFPQSVMWDAFRYALTVFAAMGLWPYIFNRLKL